MTLLEHSCGLAPHAGAQASVTNHNIAPGFDLCKETKGAPSVHEDPAIMSTLSSAHKGRSVLSARRIALVTTIAVLGAAALFTGGSTAQFPTFPAAHAAENTQRPMGFADLVEQVKPAVVSVRVKMKTSARMRGTNRQSKTHHQIED